MLFSLLFFFAFFSLSVMCQNMSVPSVLANDSSTNGTLPGPSASLPIVEAQQIASNVPNTTQSFTNANASFVAQRSDQMKQSIGDNGTLQTRIDPSNASNGSAIVVGPSLFQAVANSSMIGTGNVNNTQQGSTVTPLSLPTPLSMQVQLQQNGSVVPQVPSSNFGNAPLVFEAQTCSSDDCNGRGTCIGTKSFPVCLCNGGSAGNRCQDAPCDPSVNCNSRGFCIGTLAIASCFCNIGYTGNQCQYQNGK